MTSFRAAVSVLILAFATCAGAAAPLSKATPPGFYRMMVGDFEVTAISDGTVDLPMDQLMLGTTKEKVDAAANKAFLGMPVETSVNGYLVNTGTKLVLVDTGAGPLFGPTLGKLLANLKAAGYQPEQVDEIYITHMHPDHVGGLATDGKLNFPNAIVRADKHDADYWLSKENLEKADKGSKGFFQGAQSMLDPYVKAGKFKAIEGNTELVPGIKSQASYGHTAGHTTYIVESKGQKLVLWGDIMHLAAMQFADPSLTIKFDTDAKSAAAERKKAYADAAKGGYWVAGAHLQFPGIGHLVAAGKGYTFVPANYLR
ncbi:MAG TPA: MBL fold metallo-hydrolase [Usitatibacter sp.]|jgi:glyoxylase-like metal-dependent hydrolase (beta-lactamase superfamily II)